MTLEQQAAMDRAEARAAAMDRAETKAKYDATFGGKNYVRVNEESGTFEAGPGEVSAGNAGARGYVQGGTFGTGDEIVAGAAAAAHSLLRDDGQSFKDSYRAYLGYERDRLDKGREDHPVAAYGGEIVGAIGTGVGLAKAGLTLTGKASTTAGNIGRGAAEGFGYGGAYGFGAGKGGAGNRAKSAFGSAAMGAVGGAGLTAAAYGAGAGVRRAMAVRAERAAQKAVAANTGSTPHAVQVVGRAIEADGPEQVVANIRRAGPDAMLADGGEALAKQLDTATNASMGSARVARDAVERRATDANRRLTATLDDTLGAPRGERAIANDIAASTRGARNKAYEAAYATPIDYAASTGRNIEKVLKRTPARILRQAIRDANEAMLIDGIKNRQIMAIIADGKVRFKEMPNVQQLDEIKKALQEIGREVDGFMRPTGNANRVNGLARDLRDAIGDAAPEYRAAVAAGRDKIAQDSALRLGRSLLSARTTREEVMEGLARMGPSERSAVRQGVRSYLDDTVADVRQMVSDPNIDAREARKALDELSSQSARTKIKTLLGGQASGRFFKEISHLRKAFELRARVGRNSATAARTAMRDEVRAIASPGVARTAAQGELTKAGKQIIRSVTRQTPEAMLRREDAVWQSTARLLTQARGEDAVRQAQQLVHAMRQQGASNTEIMAALRDVGAAPVVGGKLGDMLGISR